MIELLDYRSIIDIGFVGFVTLTCFTALGRDNGSSEHRKERWRAELKELEESLRGLIREAGQASASLDRSLLQRKRELESLLRKLEEKERNGTYKISSSIIDDDEFPNSTWVRGVSDEAVLPKTNAPAPQLAQRGEAKKSDASELEALITSAHDTVSISTPPQLKASPEAAPKNMVSNSALSSLAQQIELINAEEELENATYELTSIMDRGTYRIARRLLNEGKELDIVARKLELPVSEVRLLERLMRQEKLNNGAEDMPRKEKYHVVREKKLTKPSYLRQSIELDIEREVALL